MQDSLDAKKDRIARYVVDELSKYAQVDAKLTNEVIGMTRAVIEVQEEPANLERNSSYALHDVLLSKDFQEGRYVRYKNVLLNLREILTFFLETSLIGAPSLLPLPLSYKLPIIAGMIIQTYHEFSKHKTVELKQMEAIVIYYLHKRNAYSCPVSLEEIKEGVNQLWQETYGGKIKEESISYAIKKLKRYRIIDEHEGNRYTLKEKVAIEDQK